MTAPETEPPCEFHQPRPHQVPGGDFTVETLTDRRIPIVGGVEPRVRRASLKAIAQ